MRLRLSLPAATMPLLVSLLAFTPIAERSAAAQAAGAAKPGAPAQTSAAPAAGQNLQVEPVPAANADPFPKPDPRFFTADAPDVATVNSFLRQSWGYDPNRIWQVEAILKTPVAGVSKIVVFVAEKGSQQKPVTLQFFTLPDGKHLISDDVLPFGSKPFAENRRLLEAQANGPARGAAGKSLLLVEFADYQCPHCKDAQATVDKLVQDFPNARYVYQQFPLEQIHTEAFKAAAYGVCAAQAGGSEAFFKFSAAAYEAQASLTPEGSNQALKDAVTKAGLDPEKVAACSASAATKAAVDASVKLGQELNVTATPTLFVNGRGLPLGSIPYEELKQIVAFQAAEDGAVPTLGK